MRDETYPIPVFVNNRPKVRRRVIVNDDRLKVRERLVINTIESFREEFGLLIDRDYDCNSW
jgi:hypothetical protein